MKHKRILLIPTPFWVDVFVGGTLEQVEETLNELLDSDIKIEMHDDDDALTAEIECRNKTSFLLVLTDFTDHIIAHEASHVTWFLGKKIGLKWDHESQELQAYYIDYIVREINKMK